MSEEDDLGARARRLGPEGRRALLDDLESIRALLEDENASVDAIPVLREVVRPAEDHAPAPRAPVPLAPAPSAGASGTQGEVQGDLFDPRAFADRLLDGEWAAERERILADAKAGVDAFSLGLDEAERREREARLREAVSTQLGPRMELVLGEAVDELRANMLRVIGRELDALVRAVFAEHPPQSDGRGDGKDATDREER